MSQAYDLTAQAQAWCDGALLGRREPLAKLTTLFERDDDAAWSLRAACMQYVRQRRPQPTARILALTGAPGVGKSTLVAALLRLATTRHGVLAIDPASERSGGALLGDRTRAMTAAAASQVFFRSQSTQGALGGVAEATASVMRLWAYLFDVVLIETVGVGQNETAVTSLAPATWLVVQPAGGDQLQFLKAGLMERVDRFVVNKGDMPEAAATLAHLRASLGATADEAPRQVALASARTGLGLAELAADVHALPVAQAAPLEAMVLRWWCQRALGRRADAVLATHGGAAAWAAAAGGAEHAWMSARQAP